MPTLQTMELQELERFGSNQPGLIDSPLSPRPVEPAEEEIEAPQLPSADHGRPAFLVLIGFTALIKYSRLRRWCGPLGLIMTTASLVASAYATTVGQLIATQGVLYAIGCGLLFSPTSLYLDEWFVERKGMAYGVMWAGKSAVGVVMPFIMNAFLQRNGMRATLLIWAVVSAILTIPLLVLLKLRIPLSAHASTAQRLLSFAFAKSTYFWMLQTGSMLQSMGYLMPQTYLAS
ncbi:hypothetical protein PG994_007792 [Apiospora phragmitis]|uniref:Monocarboxylate transporter n=1 Tax=Apiospora phragmitis TaxID=2905665 RepID=A0ABR1UR73_9PEZI